LRKFVWQAVGGIGCFLFYNSQKKWMVSGRESMEAGSGRISINMRVNSTAAAPDQITEQWKASEGTAGKMHQNCECG
jgi:hypothetical protein